MESAASGFSENKLAHRGVQTNLTFTHNLPPTEIEYGQMHLDEHRAITVLDGSQKQELNISVKRKLHNQKSLM